MIDPAPACPGCLSLQTLYNTRDLGGYACAGGRSIVTGRFLRSDAPVRLNQDDLRALVQYPVRTVIDLRSLSEIRLQPNNLQHYPGIGYFHIPLLGDELDREMDALTSFEPHRHQIGLTDLYIHLIERSKMAIGAVMRQLADAPPGASLFHCSHGKDRTGLIAALLLLAAGADEADIIENYRISYSLLKPWFNTFIHELPAESLVFFNTDAENMRVTLSYLARHYGAAEDYLRQCGLDAAYLARLQSRLLDP